ncbi:MAG: hypothetical protein LDL41_24565 [Coleofasciculus sp. S288]|nr:hypothetical protein [Coleofasciculus sp. S288]
MKRSDRVSESQAVMRSNLEEAIALHSSPCFPEMMGVGEDAIAQPSSSSFPERMRVGEGASP